MPVSGHAGPHARPGGRHDPDLRSPMVTELISLVTWLTDAIDDNISVEDSALTEKKGSYHCPDPPRKPESPYYSTLPHHSTHWHQEGAPPHTIASGDGQTSVSSHHRTGVPGAIPPVELAREVRGSLSGVIAVARVVTRPDGDLVQNPSADRCLSLQLAAIFFAQPAPERFSIARTFPGSSTEWPARSGSARTRPAEPDERGGADLPG